jgi:hypothetical protein
MKHPSSGLLPGPGRSALLLLAMLHLGAVWMFFPATQVFDTMPLFTRDFPVHTHRVFMYRQGLESAGIPWGYDPATAAGSLLAPNRDLGAKSMQVFGALLPFLSPGVAVRLFLFLALVTFPLWIFLAGRRMGFPEDQLVWILFTLLAMAWLDPRITDFWRWGLVCFAASAYFSIYVLALFENFLHKPSGRLYLALCLSSSGLFLLHIVGPVILIPALILFTFAARPLGLMWRAALITVPLIVLAVNAFWFIPYWLARHLPSPEGMEYNYPPDGVAHLKFGALSELAQRMSDPLTFGPLLLGSFLALYGFFILYRQTSIRITLSLGIACFFGLFLMLFGSFIPVAHQIQPMRMLIPTFVFLTIPVGLVLARLARLIRFPVIGSAVLLAMLYAGSFVLLRHPEPLELPAKNGHLSEFIAKDTDVNDRLAIQSTDGYMYDGYETKIFPLILDREVIGSNFQITHDAPQFLSTMLLGRPIPDWEPDLLKEALTRWGLAWIFTVTPDARLLLATALDEPGQTVGNYQAFRVPGTVTRFASGTGQIKATVNRLELTQLEPDEGLVVLRYRFHPGWRADADIPIYSFAVPEDPAGFIALKNPPASVTLQFDPWAMLHEPWPEAQLSPSSPP